MSQIKSGILFSTIGVALILFLSAGCSTPNPKVVERQDPLSLLQPGEQFEARMQRGVNKMNNASIVAVFGKPRFVNSFPDGQQIWSYVYNFRIYLPSTNSSGLGKTSNALLATNLISASSSTYTNESVTLFISIWPSGLMKSWQWNKKVPADSFERDIWPAINKQAIKEVTQ